MSAVNDLVVREYFEAFGFLVSQPRKYMVMSRQKTAEEEIDLLVYNPRVREHVVPDHLVWTSHDLKTVSRAIVAVRGWHTERFYVSRFELTPDILRFAETESLKLAARFLGSESIAKILCLPKLPASGELKQKTIQALSSKGLDGVISFETILAELVDMVDINKNYERSDLLQIIRILKNYGLMRDRQLDMFARQHRKLHGSRVPKKSDVSNTANPEKTPAGGTGGEPTQAQN